MRKILFSILFLLIMGGACDAAAPSRTYNYVLSTVIDPNQVNTNENSLYTYLQAGVDTYSPLSISNGSISGSANIDYSKLNLLGQIKNVDISSSAGIVGSKLDLTAPGAIGSVTPNTGSFTNFVTSGTVNIGSTHQGDVFYDNGTSVVRLTPGTNGQYFQTQGVAANPKWSSVDNIQVFTSSGSFTAPAGVTKVYLTMVGSGAGGGSGAAGTASSRGAGGGGSGAYIINFPYTVVPTNSYTITINSAGTGGAGVSPAPTVGNSGNNGGTVVFDTVTVNGGTGGTGGGTSGTSPGGAGGTVAAATNSSGSTGGTGGAIGVAGLTGGTAASSGTSGGAGGAASLFGAGGDGKNGATSTVGGNGTGFGSGGGGSGGVDSPTTSGAGGDGAKGIVIVMY